MRAACVRSFTGTFTAEAVAPGVMNTVSICSQCQSCQRRRARIARNARPETWRIDELAQQAGLTVDTIRYYAREGLLPPPGALGPAQALRPPSTSTGSTRIRELQEQRFSLAAIRAMLDADRPGLEGALRRRRAASYTLDDLVERSGLDPALVDRLRDVGLLADPVGVRARGLRRQRPRAAPRRRRAAATIGMTEDILVELGAIYVRHFGALQADVHEMLAGRRPRLGRRTSSSRSSAGSPRTRSA